MPNDQDTANGQTSTEPATPVVAAAPAAAPAPTSLLADAPAADTAAAPADDAAKPDQTDAEKQAATDQAAKDAEEAAKADAVPEEYEDFAAPDGMKLDADVTAEFKGLAKELGLSQAKAQKVADMGPKLLAKWQAQQADATATTVAQWANDTKADTEIGGDKLAENLAVAKTALDTFGTPALKAMLNESGLGNHPEVIRLLHKVGKATSEDGVVTGQGVKTPVGAAQRMYPNMNP